MYIIDNMSDKIFTIYKICVSKNRIAPKTSAISIDPIFELNRQTMQ